MRLLACLLLLFSLTFCQVLAQKGGYYITHHSPEIETIDNINFDLLQDQNGMLCIANRKGILIYDGIYWDHVPTPSSVFSLGLSEDNTLYLGCRDGFGKLVKGSQGLYYKDLSTGYDLNDVFEVVYHNSRVYFLTELKLVIYSPEKNEVEKVINGPKGYFFNSIFVQENKVYVDVELEGVYEVSESGLEISESFPPETDIVFAAKNPNADELITLTGENDFYLFRSNKLWPLEISNSDFLDDTEITDITWVNDTLITLATLERGCLIINPIKRELTDVIDYRTGLKENEIYAVSHDSDQGIWAMHSQGLSRIDPSLPIYNYSIYPGLEGNILSVYGDSILHIGTSAGLYRLEKVKRFEEVEFQVKVNQLQRVVVPDKSVQKEEPKPEEEAVEEEKGKKKKKRKKGFLRILGKKDKNEEPEEEVAEPVVTEAPKTKTITRSVSKLETRTRKELKSERFEFSRVDEIGLKCDQIVPFGSGIVTLSASGLFQVNGRNVSRITELPTRKFLITKNGQWIVAVLADDQLALIRKNGDEWDEPKVYDFLYDEIFSITEDENQNLWLIGSTEFYKARIIDDKLEIVDDFNLENPYYDQFYPFVGEEYLYLISESTYSVFNPSNNGFTTRQADSIWGNKIERIIPDGEGLWVSNGERWTSMNKGGSQSNLHFFMLWRNISRINQDGGQVWLATEDNQIHRIDLSENKNINWSSNLLLKEVRNQSEIVEQHSNISIDSENNHVSFEFRYPGYINQDDLRYQFDLRGPANSLSDWSSNNTISYSYLPAGRYELLVKSRNGAGELIEGKVYKFRIRPPYWDQPWFYALEALFFGFILYLSIRLNRKNPSNFISKVLTFFTLILIIEFIQTSVEARIVTGSSLFITFLVNAGIAFMIFPFERLLRSIIIRNREKE